MNKLDKYLLYIQDQGSAPGGGPPAKFIQLKSSGAEQDDVEPPTTARTKRFEKDEAKVGVKEFDIAALATSPRFLTQAGATVAAYGTVSALQKRKKRKVCQDKYPNNPQAVEICVKGGKP